ncbi:glycosyltransferase family 4 protein [Pseudanabaena sp. Chao 1811]|uniref:glycosyltransferase family 4 protein n=1 Tax=Pseudanabaena sp. Chao 1811 TaxID=2963092 RepID=UPI0022F392D6|nr:glycosyltransferase family 4 protein [Pseudanabaena sp. Chao 1811]
MESHKTVAFFLNRVDCNDGITSHCETLIRGLRNAGWKVVLITGKVGFDDNSLKRLQALKELSEEWIVFDSFNSIFLSLTSFFKILNAINYHRIQVFHAHGYSMLFLTFALKIFTGIKCVATSHLLNYIRLEEIRENKYLKFKHFLFQTYLKVLSPKIFIAISSAIEQWLIQDIGIPDNKIKKIFNGIDNKYFYPPSDRERQEARAKLQITEQDFVVTLVGRLQWNKGHKILIDAANHIKRSNPKYHFKYIFAGSGDQREEIEKYAFENEENCQTFLFLGYVNEPRNVYWASDVIVLPSQAEGFALVIVESMTCGIVPIRTPAAGAYDQIEDGQNGFIIPFDDLEALSSRLLQLYENTNLRLQMVENALKYSANKFTIESMTLGTISAYEEAIAK